MIPPDGYDITPGKVLKIKNTNSNRLCWTSKHIASCVQIATDASLYTYIYLIYLLWVLMCWSSLWITFLWGRWNRVGALLFTCFVWTRVHIAGIDLLHHGVHACTLWNVCPKGHPIVQVIYQSTTLSRQSLLLEFCWGVLCPTGAIIVIDSVNVRFSYCW